MGEQVDGRRNSVVCVETGITFWRMSESRRETSVPTRQSDATLSITAAPYLHTSLSLGTNYSRHFKSNYYLNSYCKNCYAIYMMATKAKATHERPLFAFSILSKLVLQSPQYPLTQSSTCFSFPLLLASSSKAPTLLHLCVSSRSQCSYSASTTSFSMRFTTRSATSRS